MSLFIGRMVISRVFVLFVVNIILCSREIEESRGYLIARRCDGSRIKGRVISVVEFGDGDVDKTKDRFVL